MAKEIYISTTPHETRLAIVEDEQLAEIYYERENEYTLAGSIYNGKVTRVLPGMQSSFVDIGLERDAFLYVTDFMEEQGDADFDSDGSTKVPASRDDSRQEGRNERKGRGDRDRHGRDRNRTSAAQTDTQSFDEPIAPQPVEASAAESAGEDGGSEEQHGSRRWRGRRGRRRGRSFREGESSSPEQNGATESEASADGDLQDTFVLEGSSVEDEQATELANFYDSAPAADYEEEPPSEADAAYALRRSARREEIRRGRKRQDAAPAEEQVSEAESAPVAYAATSVPVPFVLPGESIRKYRKPEEVAHEDEARAVTLPPKPTAAVAAPSFEVAGWDGGAVLPGESLSRHRRNTPALSAEKVETARQPETPVMEAGASEAEIESPVAGHASAPEPALAESEPKADQGNEPSAYSVSPQSDVVPNTPGQDASPVVAGEYEPAEGESASLTDKSRRDLRRLEQRSEVESQPEQQDEGKVLEELAPAPDATTYDLPAVEPTSSPAPVAGPPATENEAVHVPEQHSYTVLQASGEMLSEPDTAVSQGLEPQPVSQDAEEVSALEECELSTPADFDEASPVFVGQLHAYGEGDLEEEELDGDEYEYDLALAAVEEEELDEYEEETLDDDSDLGSALQELAQKDRAVPVDDLDGTEYAAESDAGGFSVEDFGGEPDEEDEASSDAPVNEAIPQERRGKRQDGRRFSRERRSGGGFRGGSGGDRGRGRQSVQTMDLPAINELLKPGQEILVQIAKEPIAKKGARITSHIALPGRFLVFMPTVNHTGVSRKISSDEERRRLKSILLSEKGEAQGGFIVRTAADGASEEELRNDLRFLIQLWQDIKMRSESSKSPALIYHDLSLVERILRDQVTDNFSAIWVDTETEYERVLRFLQRFQPSLVRRVKLYTKETPLFEHFGVTQEIDKALKSKVWLKSGGSIVINQTEALVAIDINTGKYVGKTARLEDTILKTNLDAIPEIVRQIRLRDLGGIIVIDFIDMDERKNRARVMQVLEDELKSDRAPSKVLPFNDFGLVIMTRKRVKQSLERTLCIPDPITEGTGMIKSPITVANEIYVEMRKMYRHMDKADVMLRVHPEVVKQLKAAGGKRLQELEEMTHKTILVKSDPALNPEQFDIH